MIRQVLKVFKALNSNEKPWQLSLGLAFGGIIGLMPLWTPTQYCSPVSRLYHQFKFRSFARWGFLFLRHRIYS